VRLLLVGVHEGLGIFENEWKMLPQQFAITEVGMLERVDESFPWCLHYCIDNNGGHFEPFGND
jgi:hypothetical protein